MNTEFNIPADFQVDVLKLMNMLKHVLYLEEKRELTLEELLDIIINELED